MIHRRVARPGDGPPADIYILGADSILPGDIDWERSRVAIDTAHAWERM